ncbi:MAG TPA: glycoside hydrolase family 15 protein, partial [Kiloniellales bacterium]|nr:glycoside hydrolase family 15 protein [Kiloniellales bacterium]
CWAACDRLTRVARRLGLAEREAHWREQAQAIRAGILKEAWNDEIESFVDGFGGSHVDASLLLLPELGFLAPDDERFLKTLACIEARLRRGDHLIRYEAADDFGLPRTSFIVCTFWYVNALWAVGREDEARTIFETMLAARNSLGLLSEDIDFDTLELWGNYPQTYSMVGLINSAMRLSRSWEEAF